MMLNCSDPFLKQKTINRSPNSCVRGGRSSVVTRDSPTRATKFTSSFIPLAFLPEPIPAPDYITGDKWIE